MRNLCMNVVRTDSQSSTVPVCLSFVCPPPLSPALLPTALLYLNQVNLKGSSCLLLFFVFRFFGPTCSLMDSAQS